MKVDDITKIAQGKYINFFKADGHGESGPDKIERNFVWEFFSRKNEVSTEPDSKESPADAVVVIALHVKDEHDTSPRLVLIKQFRPPVRDFVYELPAGIIDPGEDAETAAKRELKEETGLDVIEIIDKSPKIYNSPGCTDETCCVVTVACIGELSTSNLEDNEFIETMLLTNNDMADIMRSDPIMGAKCWLVMGALDSILK